MRYVLVLFRDNEVMVCLQYSNRVEAERIGNSLLGTETISNYRVLDSLNVSDVRDILALNNGATR